VALVLLAVVQLLAEPAAVTAGALALAAATPVPLAAARRSPGAAAGLVSLGIAGQALVLGVPTFASFLSAVAASYALARYAGAVGVVAGGMALSLAVLVVAQSDPAGSGVFELVYPLVYLGGAAVVGVLVRRRAELSAVRAAAAESATRLAAVTERTRIAREMHDVVAHGVSLMVVQAEAAEAVLRSRPDDAAAALGRIQDSGREALVELQRLLGVLRADDGGAGPDVAAGAPPSLGHLDELVGHARACGVTVASSVTPDAHQVRGGVGEAAYRVVQEALTNVVRHARATRAEVRVTVEGGSLVVEVRDDGVGPARGQVTVGRGLIGMRERVAIHGGTVQAEPAAGGGFCVFARLPLEGEHR
jgi:signal transduction histidine kinase